jgi:hypothetical protein
MLGATQTLRVLRPVAGDRDAEGRKTLTFTETARVRGNLFERTSQELTDGQWTVVSNWTALVPPATQVTHRDVLVAQNGARYRVESVAARLDFRGKARHIACQLVRVEE